MSEAIRIESDTSYRMHGGDCFGTLEMGDRQVGVRFQPRDSAEFLLRVGKPGEVEPSVEVEPGGCASPSVSSSPGGAAFEFLHGKPDLRVEVHSTVGPGPRLRKWLNVQNTGDGPLVLFDVVLERISVPDDVRLSGGGRGWPVFIEGVGFAAVEFPESENLVSADEYSLEYYPAVTLRPGEAYHTEPAILEFAPDDPLFALRQYVNEFKLRRSSELFVYYCSWGAHEYEGPTERVVNEQLDHLIDLKENWRIPFSHFILDYGYWPDGADPAQSGDFARIDEEKRFPGDSFSRILKRMSDADIELGMWFQIGCPARKEFVANLRESFLALNSKYGMRLIKTDFSDWNCTDPSHDHLPGKYMRCQAAHNMIEALGAAKAADPEVVIYATSFTRSPWWLKHVDFIVVGKEDPSDVAAPSLVDSQILHTDLDHRFFELDAGTYINYSDCHFWCGKQFWRKNLIMSVCRSNQLFLAGELHLLDKDDKLFLQRVLQMWKVHAAAFGSARRVLGDPSAGEVYGYANVRDGRGLVALFNPSWEAKGFDVGAADLGCDPSVRNVCAQLYPHTEVAAIPARGGHFHARIGPWEVQWLEVGPSEAHSELLESKSQEGRICTLPVTAVFPPEEMAGGLTLPLERTFFHTGSTLRCRPTIPRKWDGFPLLMDFRGVKGELYVNNHPFGSEGDAGFALVYAWTREYGLVKFGGENSIWFATTETDIPSQNDIVVRPTAYFSGSACREDWVLPGEATAVVLVRYLKEGKPFRHSIDPRTAQCAVWLDGAWMELYRVPPLVPRIWSRFSWAVFMLDLGSDWECVRIVVPRLVDCDYEVDFFLTNRLTAVASARGE